MECAQHPGTSATARCLACARPFCNDCLENVNGQHHCHACATRIRQGLSIETAQALPPRPEIPAVAQQIVTSRLAVAAFVFGICAVFCGITAIPAVICGLIAVIKITNSNGRLSGLGFAVAGILIGGVFFLVAPIVAAIAIPNLLRSRMQSNESAAIGRLRVVIGAETAYHAAHGEYADSFDDLTSETPPYLDGNWSISNSGYHFTLQGNPYRYEAHADPEMFGNSGNRGFFADETGVIRYSIGEPASRDGTPIGQ